VESLIGPDTISTVPVETLELFEDHGKVSTALGTASGAEGRKVMDALAAAGIDFDDVNTTLEREGIDKFVKSFDSLLGVIAQKRRALAR
jgi:transaldolase